MPTSRCEALCPICGNYMDWMRGYGRDARCCGKDCHDEFEWRRALAITGAPYRQRTPADDPKPA